MIYQDVRKLLDDNKDVSVSIIGYVELLLDPNLTHDFEYLWKKGKDEAFRYKNGKMIYLVAKQTEVYKQRQ